jgi:type II secretory pathway pseudopilin PulG
VEVLAAVLLLSIALLAILTATQAARDTQRRALWIATGRNIAQSRMDTLKSLSPNSLSSYYSQTEDPSLPDGNTVTVSCGPYPVANETNLFRATVVVRWPEGQGVRKVSYETLIARK